MNDQYDALDDSQDDFNPTPDLQPETTADALDDAPEETTDVLDDSQADAQDFHPEEVDNELDEFDDSQADLPADDPAVLTLDEIAKQRCCDAAEAIDNLYHAHVDFINSGARIAPEDLYDHVELFLDVVGESPSIGWAQPAWTFLEQATIIGTLVSQAGFRWRETGQPWDVRLLKPIQLAHAERTNLLNPKVPQDKIVELETIEEFIEQKMNDRQIAVCYGWYDGGEPDWKKARACRRGEVDAPTEVTYAAKVPGPSRQPHLGPVDSCLAIFLELKEQEARETIEV